MVLILCAENGKECCSLCPYMRHHGVEVKRASSDAAGFDSLRGAQGKVELIVLIGPYSELEQRWPLTNKLKHESFGTLSVMAVEK